MYLRLISNNGFSRFIGRIAGARAPRFLLRFAIRIYARFYRVRLEDMALPMDSFETFNSFFTRQLKPELRPIADAPIISPVDGIVGMTGQLDSGLLTQIKGREYTLGALLGDASLEGKFRKGSYITLYLSPRHYHRIHAPAGGMITGYRYIPGRLFPVNESGLRKVDELFVVNERLITLMQTGDGSAIAVVKVGATNVGSITVTYDEIRTNVKGQTSRIHDYPEALPIQKGDEVGRFNLGSTVVLLVENPRLKLLNLKLGQEIQMGEAVMQASSDQSADSSDGTGGGGS